jgi:hypothetical protein
MKPASLPVASLAALTAIALLSLTAAARADDKPADAGPAAADTAGDAILVQHPPPLVRLKLIGLGLLVSGGAWGASFGSGQYWNTVPGAGQLKIPVVGPWIALGKSGCASDDPGCSGGKIGVRGAIYVLDGITQLAGLGLIVEAIVMKTESAAPEKKAAFLGLRFRGLEVTPVPVTSPTFTGLGLVGTF